jgi:DNA repair photolyase
MDAQKLRGRGTAANPPNRFERLWYEAPAPGDIAGLTAEEIEEAPAPQTQFFKDHARSILTRNNSPDIGFEYSINAYRGCEHGCIYCYARPTHEYLGFASGLDFETRIMVKEDAPQLLRKELSARSWKSQVISMSGVTDCYQPVERKLQLTRRVLEVLLDFRNPVGIITKNFLVTRDIDLLSEMAQYNCAAVFVSVTTLDRELARIMEPRTAQPARRLEAIRKLSEGGIPTGVLVCPVIPGLTDHEMPAIVQACAEAGAQFAGYNMLHLPYAVKDLFDDWLSTHLPEKRNKVLSKIRDVRGGKLNDSNFGTRMTGEGPFADQVKGLFKIACKKAGIANRGPRLSTENFRKPTAGQLQLFD